MFTRTRLSTFQSPGTVSPNQYQIGFHGDDLFEIGFHGRSHHLLIVILQPGKSWCILSAALCPGMSDCVIRASDTIADIALGYGCGSIENQRSTKYTLYSCLSLLLIKSVQGHKGTNIGDFTR